MNELNHNMIMDVFYSAMWEYNFNVHLNTTDESLARRRRYINGLSTMAETFGIRVITTYENAFINSPITDIIVNGESVTKWKIGIEKG